MIAPRSKALRQRKEELLRLSAMAERRLATPVQLITPKKLEAFAAAVREKLLSGDIQFVKRSCACSSVRSSSTTRRFRSAGRQDRCRAGSSGAA
jgi:hypothetical protein